MLGPDDVEDLMQNQGLLTREVESLAQFYNDELKGKSLETILDQVETLLLSVGKENNNDMAAELIPTPKCGSCVELSQDIAQENFLRATMKM